MPQVTLTQFVEAARSGMLVSFPTDTVPALAVRPDRSALIFELKQRSQTKPLILMGGRAADLWPYVSGSAAELALWQNLTDTYWPGALTLVLPASDRLPPEINPLDPLTIGIRVPDQPIARHLLTLTGPLATTSVNRSGEPPLQTLAAVNAQFPEVYTLLPAETIALADRLGLAESAPVDPTAAIASGVPSTVAKWQGDGWEILRQGAVELEEIGGRR